jgi:Na+/proline symporter
MDKKKLQLGLIFAILFVAYAVVLFLLNKNWTLTFWLSLGFIVVAFAFVMFAFFFVSKESRKQQVVGMPVTVLTVMYAVIEFIMGTIFMFFDVVFAAVFVPQFIVFVLFLLCLLKTFPLN